MEKDRWIDKRIFQNKLYKEIENASDLNDGLDKQTEGRNRK